MENPTTKHPGFGPWHGIDESTDIGRARVRDGLNVVFRDGRIQRRPGRRVVAVDAAGRRVVGLHEHASVSGARTIIAYHEPAGAEPGGLSKVDWNAGATVDVTMPPPVADVEEGGSSCAVSMDGHTIIAEPGGVLLDFDGERLSVLTAVRGVDAAVEAESYLAAAPRASALSIWRDRLVAAADPAAPRTIGLSENKWASDNIPDEAPIGGANVWPQRTNFDYSTEDGDTIAGLSVLFDRLIVVGGTGVNVVDEDSVAPVARPLARELGCIAPRSIACIGNAVIYLGERNILLFEGATARSISGPLRRTLDELVDWDSAHLAVAVHLRQAQEYRL